MSEYTKTALYGLLTGDAALAALLGDDENGKPAVFNATMNQKLRDLSTPASSWTYDCITFREADGPVDPRFTAGLVGAEFFDIEIWSQSNSAVTIPRIAARVIALLHNETLTVTSGKVYCCELVSQRLDQYDDKLHVHFGLMRLKLVVGN